jgi:hypothetical protein
MRTIGMILLVIVVFVVGCAPTVMEGKKIDAGKVNTLALDQPKDQVISAFGPPLKTESLPTGEMKYVYHYSFKKPHWWTVDEVERQDMEVLLKNDRVESFKFKGIGASDANQR